MPLPGDEATFQKVWGEYKTFIDQWELVAREYSTAHAVIIRCWLDEHYPGLVYHIIPHCTRDRDTMRIITELSIKSSREIEIRAEIEAYLRQLEI